MPSLDMGALKSGESLSHSLVLVLWIVAAANAPGILTCQNLIHTACDGRGNACETSRPLSRGRMFAIIAGFPENLFVCFGVSASPGASGGAVDSLRPSRPGGSTPAMPVNQENHHETHLSSIQSPPRPYPRLPGPHEDPRRPRRHQRTPRQGPQAPGRLTADTSPAPLPVDSRCRSHRRSTASGALASMQRLKTRAQFQAVLAGATVARTAHFALHRCALDRASRALRRCSPSTTCGWAPWCPSAGPAARSRATRSSARSTP